LAWIATAKNERQPGIFNCLKKKKKKCLLVNNNKDLKKHNKYFPIRFYVEQPILGGACQYPIYDRVEEKTHLRCFCLYERFMHSLMHMSKSLLFTRRK